MYHRFSRILFKTLSTLIVFLTASVLWGYRSDPALAACTYAPSTSGSCTGNTGGSCQILAQNTVRIYSGCQNGSYFYEYWFCDTGPEAKLICSGGEVTPPGVITADPNTCTISAGRSNCDVRVTWSGFGVVPRASCASATFSTRHSDPNRYSFGEFPDEDPEIKDQQLPAGHYVSAFDRCGTLVWIEHDVVAPPTTCTITVSPSALTLIAGRRGIVTANATITSGPGSVSSVDWTSSVPAVATASTPGNSSTITSLSAGTTNVSATANLSPSGSCTTSGTGGNSSPTVVTVVSSFFQTFGGDVTAKGIISNANLPANRFISGRR